MLSKIFVIVLAAAIGLLLVYLPIWPWLMEWNADPGPDYMSSGARNFQSRPQSWMFTNLVEFYDHALRSENTLRASTRTTNSFFCMISPFVLIFIPLIIARMLHKIMIYLWNLE